MFKRIVETVEASEARFTEFVRSLVRIPTITAYGPEGSYDEIIEILKRNLSNIGFAIDILESEPNKPNLVARKPGKNGASSLHFNGHVDVLPVSQEDWSVNPFSAELMDGRIYGRGTIDMKGGLASAILAAEVLHNLGVKLSGDIIISAVVDEEVGGQAGLGFLVSQHPESVVSTSAIIPEPTEMNSIVVSNKGALWLDFETSGVSVHSAYPKRGVNAIAQMVQLIEAVSRMIMSRTKRDPLIWEHDPEVSTTSMNLGVISGGVKPNIVPDRCRLSIDIRLLPGERCSDYIEKVQEIIRELKKTDPTFDSKVEIPVIIEPTEISKSEPLVITTSQCVQKVTGQAPKIVGAPWFSDRHYLVNILGVPCLHFGPGRCGTDRCGGSNEYIEVEELKQMTVINALIMLEMLGSTT
ncbi:MAG: M20 family metallopeptidase [Promethearchaeota archaeon]